MTDKAVHPGLRSAAIVTSTVVAALVAAGAIRLAASLDPVSYGHAVAILVGSTGAALTLGAFVPAPGFPGWPGIVALVDLRGALGRDRIWRAAWLARRIAVAILLLGAAAAILLGEPVFLAAGGAIALLTWGECDSTVAHDELLRFLASRRAGDVARPIMRRVGPSDQIRDVLADRSPREVVLIVEAGGRIVGAVGPEVTEPGRPGTERTCGEVMTTLSETPIVAASAPAAAVLPGLVRRGFVLVRDQDVLGVVDARDLGRQVRVWQWLADHRRDRGTRGRGRGREV